MKGVLLKKHGNKNVLEISELPEPAPQDNEVKVKLETIGLNYAEILSRKGLYGWAPKLPYIPGMEGYGRIVEIGKNVKKRKVGEKVIVGAQFGAYAEFICVPAYHALPAVSKYSPEENAAFAVHYLTAYISLFNLGRLQKGEKILIQSAAGGVGTAAVQLAKAAGAIVFGTASSEEKIKLIQRLGANYAINYKSQDFETEINKLTQDTGVNVVLELVGGEVFKKSLRLLAPFGRIISTGFSGLNLNKWNPLSWVKTWRDIPGADITDLMRKSLSLSSTHVGYLLDKPELILGIYQEMAGFVQKNKIKPIVGKVFPFAEIAQAQDWMESRKSVGKIVLKL